MLTGEFMSAHWHGTPGSLLNFLIIYIFWLCLNMSWIVPYSSNPAGLFSLLSLFGSLKVGEENDCTRATKQADEWLQVFLIELIHKLH